MQWEKLGLLVAPARYEWMVTHAQNPFSERLENGLYRFHFAGRDRANRARGGYALVDMDQRKVLAVPATPTIDLGRLGCFDDCGVMPSSIVDAGDKKYMYYTGWKKEAVTPFSFFIGLLVSTDGGETYVRQSPAPVLGRDPWDPYMNASPWVMAEDGIFKMWYVSCTGWSVSEEDSKPKHSYHIKYRESPDGIDWRARPSVAIDYQPGEYAIARPCVRRIDGRYQMWYCRRGDWDTYRAGYAESTDGVSWERKDDRTGIDVSESGWDSEMICYPHAFAHGQKTWMLYNGNGYGRTGVGLAVLRD